MKKGCKRVWPLFFACSLFLTAFSSGAALDAAPAAGTKGAGSEPVARDAAAPDYAAYRERHEAVYTGDTITVEGGSFSPDSIDTQAAAGIGGNAGSAAQTTESSQVFWTVEVPRAGLYSISVDYFPLPGNRDKIERKLLINGAAPFTEAESFVFDRIWKDGGAIETDAASGNDILPEQVEAPRWRQVYLRDSIGYYGERLYVWLEQGTQNIGFVSVREPLAIRSLVLESKRMEPADYETYLGQTDSSYIQGVLDGGIVKYQAETPSEKSDAMLYPINDRSSVASEPYDASRIRLNTIGREKWKTPGQWISWEIDAPQSGYYTLGARSIQNVVRGAYSSRTLYIDGKVPFKQAAQMRFTYSDKWKVEAFGDESGPYAFYLEKGKHVLTLEATLGDIAELLMQAEQSLRQLNGAYWRLLTVMGSSPDPYRNYRIDKYQPEVIETFRREGGVLEAIADAFEQRTGQRDAYTATLRQLASTLQTMAQDPESIPGLYSGFKDDIGALGNWVVTSREQPLQLDYLFLAEKGAELPAAEKGFFAEAWHQIAMLISTFVDDYSVFGNGENRDKLTVWIGSGVTGGRDQAQILKKLVTNDFSARHGIDVNLELVPSGTVLSATLAGKGPDVALQVGGSEPANYAMRNAVYDLTEFEDFEQIAGRFHAHALVPFSLERDGKTGVYALPETQSFPMMFYRKDILQGMGIDINTLKTWDDIVGIMPQLQQKHMDFGLTASFGIYATFLYQMDGSFYKDNGRASNLDADTSVEAFKKWTDFYVNYQLPMEFNFENRFRMGEMPLAIADYTTFNLLSVSAPEIRGLWGMAPVPGIRRGDTVNNVVSISGAGAIIMGQSQHKQQAWDFLKWWTDTDSQVQFGQELESLLGPASRYNTANTEAFKRLAWSAAERDLIMQQWQNARAIPEVPGGYYTSRYVDFALRDVLNQNKDPRQTLMQKVYPVNEEIKLKRKELHMD